jgi:flagellar biosynthesis protein FlhB
MAEPELPASEGRRREARARGAVAVSPIACAAGALAGVALTAWLGPGAGALLAFARRAFSAPAQPAHAAELLPAALETASSVITPIALGAAVGALAFGLVQTRGLFAPRAIGQRAPVRASRALPWALAAALALLAVSALRALLPALAGARELGTVGETLKSRLPPLGVRALILFAAAGLGDWLWRRARLERTLRMTRAEAEAERRRDEANPTVAAELRHRHRSP